MLLKVHLKFATFIDFIAGAGPDETKGEDGNSVLPPEPERTVVPESKKNSREKGHWGL